MCVHTRACVHVRVQMCVRSCASVPTRTVCEMCVSLDAGSGNTRTVHIYIHTN